MDAGSGEILKSSRLSQLAHLGKKARSIMKAESACPDEMKPAVKAVSGSGGSGAARSSCLLVGRCCVRSEVDLISR